MVLSLIDVDPMRPGWGRVYQSGELASLDPDIGPHLTVSMSGNLNFSGPVLWININDDDETTLAPETLEAMVDAVIAFLAQGKNVLIHCNEGKYRSTYMDVAVHMTGAGMSLEAAFERVRMRHPIACLRQGTEAQLREMEPLLQGGSK